MDDRVLSESATEQMVDVAFDVAWSELCFDGPSLNGWLHQLAYLGHSGPTAVGRPSRQRVSRVEIKANDGTNVRQSSSYARWVAAQLFWVTCSDDNNNNYINGIFASATLPKPKRQVPLRG